LPSPYPKRLRVAAIDFLNPAPLMWDLEHSPLSANLAERYDVHYTQPAQCAAELLESRADLGLIPIAALTPALAIVPGCVIASLDEVRSIQLIVRLDRIPHLRRSLSATDMKFPQSVVVDEVLSTIRTIAADNASLSSLAYAQILFRRFVGADPAFLSAAANPIAMLQQADAALLIGDPALLALAGLPWVAAVWAARPEALAGITPARLVEDLQHARDHGLAHIDALVDEWSPRIAIPSSVIRDYLTHNISYMLTPDCIAAISLFRQYAAEANILPPLPTLNFL
jgi:chorismate dehydratase